MIVKMSEYYLMRNYSLVGSHALILYNIIYGRYVIIFSDRKIYSICNFSYFDSSKRLPRRKFIKIYDLTKPVRIMAHKL